MKAPFLKKRDGAFYFSWHHSAYLSVSRQMPKCPFGTLRKPGRPVKRSVLAGKRQEIERLPILFYDYSERLK